MTKYNGLKREMMEIKKYDYPECKTVQEFAIKFCGSFDIYFRWIRYTDTNKMHYKTKETLCDTFGITMQQLSILINQERTS